jgi:hypothetical protein
MPDFRLLTSEVFPLTRELAEKHRAMEPSPTERALKGQRIKFLRKKLEDGLFISVSWSVAKFEGRLIRMNGQHSSIVLADCGEHFPEGLHVHFDTYEVTSRNGLAELFRQFDARQSSRSGTDVVGAYLGIFDLGDIDPVIGKRAADGICYARHHDNLGTFYGDDAGRILQNEDTHPFVQWLNGLPWDKFKEGKAKSVCGAMWQCYIRDRTRAEIFWDDVIHDRFDDESDPAHLLSLDLQAIKSRDGAWKNGKAPSVEKVYGLCSAAWNAYKAERTVKRLDFNEKKQRAEFAA